MLRRMLREVVTDDRAFFRVMGLLGIGWLVIAGLVWGSAFR